MSTTYISKITLGQSKVSASAKASARRVTDGSRSKVIEVSLPNAATNAHALTIIAGKNRTGKSHLLRHTERAIRTHNKIPAAGAGEILMESTVGSGAANVVVHPQDSRLPFGTTALINDVAALLDRFISIPLYVQSKGSPSKLEALVDIAKSKFIQFQFESADALQTAFQGVEQRNPLADKRMDAELEKGLDRIGHHRPSEAELAENAAHSDGIKRAELATKLSDALIYRANEQCPAVREFELLTSSAVYLRHNATTQSVELVLRHGPGEIFAFGGRQGGWSQGYKLMISLFILIVYGQPHILLIDELENHLHPEFISKVCAFIKKRVPQTVIVTHHPHLIFSAFTDSAWYLELEASTEEAPSTDIFPTDVAVEKRAAPKRRIVKLSSEFERIAATYALFDGRDKQLLDLASSCHEQLTIGLLLEIERGLTLEVVEAGESAFPDSQSTQISTVLHHISNQARRESQRISILDYGAGLGRVFFELQKNGGVSLLDVDWNFFDPSQAMRETLQKSLDARGERTHAPKIFSALSLIPHQSVNVVLLANVLHECTIVQICEMFQSLTNLLAEDGTILIAELTPLLSPERFGFSYSPEEIRRIATAFGYSASTSAIPIRSGLVTAHVTLGQKKRAPDIAKAAKILTDVWRTKRRDLLQQYSAEIALSSTRNAIKVASILHAIASIDAHTEGFW